MCKNYKFLDTLKYADITQLFKKGDTTEKRNYRPISTHFTFSKIFEKLIVTVKTVKTVKKGFLENCNTRHALQRMIETLGSKQRE